jgi:hypothetical protein
VADPTRSLEYILAGLSRGGQPGLSDQIRAEIEALPVEPARRRGSAAENQETRRQASVADDVVQSVVRKEIELRQALIEMAPDLGIREVDVIDDADGRTEDSLLDSKRIDALWEFLDRWKGQIGPILQEPILK